MVGTLVHWYIGRLVHLAVARGRFRFRVSGFQSFIVQIFIILSTINHQRSTNNAGMHGQQLTLRLRCMLPQKPGYALQGTHSDSQKTLCTRLKKIPSHENLTKFQRFLLLLYQRFYDLWRQQLRKHLTQYNSCVNKGKNWAKNFPKWQKKRLLSISEGRNWKVQQSPVHNRADSCLNCNSQ